MGSITVSQWFQRFSECDGDSRLRTRNGRKTSMRYFLEAVGDKPLADITIRDGRTFQQYIAARPECGASTVNSHVRNLGRVFKEAVEDGELAEHPLRPLRKMRTPKRKPQVYTSDEVERLLKACTHCRQKESGRAWQTRILLAVCAGLRRGEAMNLKVADCDFDHQEIWVREAPDTAETWWFGVKDYEDRKVPMPPTLQAFLAKRIEELPERHPYLCLTPRRYKACQRIRSEGRWSEDLSLEPDQNFDKPLIRLMRRAKIERRGRSFHALRATCITWWLQSGLPLQEVKELAGHSNIETTMEYYAAVRHDHVERASVATETIIRSFQTHFFTVDTTG